MKRLGFSFAALVFAAALALAPLAFARQQRVLSLAQVERAFKQAGVPFQQEARPNPNLAPGKNDVLLLVPTALRPHLQGVAFTFDAETFHSRAAYVFDSSVSATHFLNRNNTAAEKADIAKLRIENLVYIGSRSKAVTRALRSLKLIR